MTSREIVRTAVIVGGIWMVLTGLQTTTTVLVQPLDTWRSLRESGADLDILGDLVFYLPMSLGFGLAAALPGVLAILFSGRMARWLTPSPSVAVSVEPSLIFAVGVMLLGISTAASGVIGLASAVFTYLMVWQGETTPEFTPVVFLASSLSYSTASLAVGLLLFRWGSRQIPRAA